MEKNFLVGLKEIVWWHENEQLEGHLPSKHKAFGSNPSAAKKWVKTFLLTLELNYCFDIVFNKIPFISLFSFVYYFGFCFCFEC
jgi:hypothetical protein